MTESTEPSTPTSAAAGAATAADPPAGGTIAEGGGGAVDMVPASAADPAPPSAPQQSAPASALLTTPTPKLPKRRRRRPRPVSDTITVIIPLDVTADLGVAVRRARTKRIRKLRERHPEIFPGKRKRDDELDDEAAADDEDEGDDEEEKKGEEPRKKKQKSDEGDDEEDEDDMGAAPFAPQRDQYGSVLDYLEAKYVRGVMIAGPDDGANKKKKKEKKQSKDVDKDGSVGGDDEDDDSEMEGSIYSDSDGSFLDDSVLRSEVAGQVLASGAYGTTKVEEERRRAKKAEKREKQSGGEEDEEGDSGSDEDRGENYEDDDAFFVNVGDLEMAEGFDEAEIDYGWDDAGTKKKKKKTRKRKSATSASASSAASKKGTAKKSKSSKEAKPSASSQPAKKKAKVTTTTAKAASKLDAEKKKPNKKKQKEKPKEAAPSPASSEKEEDEDSDEKEASSNDESDQEKHDAGHEAGDDNASMASADSAAKEKRDAARKERESAAKVDAQTLKNRMEELYNMVVDGIKEMTDKELPRKRKGTMKVSITVPTGKSPGDTIMFANPHMPAQKLKMKVPKSGRPGGKVVVTVPLPEVKESEKENVFPLDLRRTLDGYSQAYDDWCDAEARRREVEPGLGPFKPGKERLKKFDDLVDEFPPDLVTPIDIVELRKVVRRTRQNLSKRKKSAAAIMGDGDGGAGSLTAKRKADIEAPTQMLELRVPGKGTAFPSVTFDDDDFTHGD